MGDLASDREAAISLIIDEYHKLQTHNPKHELLRYITDVTQDSFRYSADQPTRQAFVDKYAPTDKIPFAVMLTAYLVDLTRAVDQIEGTNRLAKPQEPVRVTPIKTLDDLNDEDIPF